MSRHDEDDETEYTSRAQAAIKTGNFKALYLKQYGDIAKLNHRHNYTPEQVFNLAVKYFTWAEENAIKAAETAAFQGIVTENLVHKVRIFTINGLSLFTSISKGAFQKWRKEDGFSDVMEFIDGVIHEQKFQLAANGIINAAFIGKDLGIDKPAEVNIENNNTLANVTTEEVKDAVRDILGEL